MSFRSELIAQHTLLAASLVPLLAGTSAQTPVALAGSPALSGPMLSEEMLAKLEAYFSLLVKWNRTVDLVAPASIAELVQRHFIDSLALEYLFSVQAVNRVVCSLLDIGSGAGFPGLVGAVLDPERKVYLCEPRQKRCVFLKEAKRALKLKNVSVIPNGAESVSEQSIELVDVSVSRALGNDPLFLRSSLRLLSDSGLALQMLGPSWKLADENRCVRYEKKTLNFSDKVPYSLSAGGPQRVLAVWSVSRETFPPP